MTGLVLRDIHEPPAPAWWPPAPGWWLLALAVLVGAAALAWWLRRRRLHRQRLERMFDDAVAGAASPTAAVAAISELLRRAGRSRDRGADTLDGEDWLRFLDRDARQPAFDGDAGRLLLGGGYRREVDPQQLEALRAAARARFLQWTTGRP